MLESNKRIWIITGHYGSGKTNLAVNLALDMRSAGKETALVDLDVVNPYFRSADFAARLEKEGIEMVLPAFAGTNLDMPGLTARMDAVIDTEKTLIIDVGGDDVGALALGRYSRLLEEAGGYELLYVVNRYRYLTQTATEADDLLLAIEAASRLKATGIVNNSNLGELTTPQIVGDSMDFARETAVRHGLPLRCTTAAHSMADSVRSLLGAQEQVLPIEIYVKKPWDS